SDLSETARLRTLTHLRRRTEPNLAAAALETAILRRRAERKFSRAADMYFTRDALEQATAETVAVHRARRFAGYDQIVDLGCGIGGDSVALSAVAPTVGVDRDRLRLLMARANARAYGHGHQFAAVQADVAGGGPIIAEAAFVDPSRRTTAGRRVFDAHNYQPPLAEVLAWRSRFRLLAVKLAPGIRDTDLAGVEAEVEFVAEGNDLKEAVLWLGAGVSEGRTATILPDGVTLHSDGDEAPPVRPAGSVLYEPNSAVIRAHLLGTLARRLDAWQFDRSIAYLSAGELRHDRFARAWSIETVLPFSVDRVRRYLRSHEVGRVTVKKRGSPLEPEAFLRMLRLHGENERTVVLTRQLGRPVALICTEANADKRGLPSSASACDER
ncbi:MAG: SAM-dependent methyltransferase, partial [Dehalococcoidia bacterium]